MYEKHRNIDILTLRSTERGGCRTKIFFQLNTRIKYDKIPGWLLKIRLNGNSFRFLRGYILIKCVTFNTDPLGSVILALA